MLVRAASALIPPYAGAARPINELDHSINEAEDWKGKSPDRVIGDAMVGWPWVDGAELQT